MRIIKCTVCNRPSFPPIPAVTGQGKWICRACEKKIDEVITNNFDAKPDYCQKCKNRTSGTCPFTARERKRIVKCNHWIGRDTEHNKRRFAKFENTED